MKRAVLIAGLLLAGSIAAHAEEVDAKKALTIANNSDCLTCHAVTKKVIGPAYRDVASKYRGDDDAPNRLLQKVKNGGSGVWGKFAMPPHPNVSDQDLKVVVDWILAGAPTK